MSKFSSRLFMDGKSHDFLTVLGTVVAGVVISRSEFSAAVPPVTIGVLFGGLWLSPDLDTQSRPLKRWGLMKFIWPLYHKTLGAGHRSWVSHSPIISSQARLIYLSIITIGLFPKLLINQFGITGFLAFCVAVEFAAAIHLFADGLNRSLYIVLAIFCLLALAML